MILNFPSNPSTGSFYLGPNGVGYTFDGIKWVVSSGSGPTGPSGAQGLQGGQGPQGLIGNTGLQGLRGAQGLQGAQGLDGAFAGQGVQGTQGVQGSSGAQGGNGLQGAQGCCGIQGAQGAQGIQGCIGLQGVQGPQGGCGLQGAQGATGCFGIQGVQGATGGCGPTGPSGPPGTGGGGSSGIVKTILLHHVANTATITGPADINSWSASYTSTSNNVEIMAFVTVSNNGLGAEPKYLYLKRDGSIVDTIAYFFTGNAHYSIGPFYYLDTSASGSHTYNIALGTSGEIASTADSCLMIATEY